MDDELRKAAGTAVDVWDDTGTRHEDVVNAMNDLRKVLANSANAASQEKGIRDILRDTVRSIIAAHSDGELDVPLAIADLRTALAKNANAAPNLGMAHMDRLCQVMMKHGMSTGHGDTIAQVIDELDLELMAKNAAPQAQNSVSVPLDFIGAVCGALNRSGESPKLLEKARNFVQHGMGHHANAAPQDQAKDAARWRFLTQQMDESEVDYLFCFDASDWAGRVDVAMQQEQKP